MKKVIIILADGFEELEAISIIDILRRANIYVSVVGLNSKTVRGSHDITILTDSLLEETKKQLSDYDLIALPGGLPGSHNLRDDERIISAVQAMNRQNKWIAAICAAPIVLAKAGVLEGKKATSYPGQLEKLQLTNTQLSTESVVVDGNIITSRGPSTAIEFSFTLVELLVGKEKRFELESKMLYR